MVEGKAHIISGLKGDETVIVEGGYHLPDGTQVKQAEEEKEEKDKFCFQFSAPSISSCLTLLNSFLVHFVTLW